MTSGVGTEAESAPPGDRRAHLRCFSCAHTSPADRYRVSRCSRCGGVLECVVDPEAWIDTDLGSELPPTQWRFGGRLPGIGRPISLAEGATPLRATTLLASEGCELWVKDETVNPSGSFKDRMSSVALSWAVEHGATKVVCASTGNAAASAAAYAAVAGLPCLVAVPEATATGKLAQVLAYGAQVVRVSGTYSDAYALAAELEGMDGVVNLTTTYRNPFAVCGLTTIGFELMEQLHVVPDYIYVPTGAGPLVRGIDRAYRAALAAGLVGSRPRMVAVQASGCAPVASAFATGSTTVVPWGTPTTRARGIADPLQGYSEEAELTLDSLRNSGGHALAVSDELIAHAADRLAGSGIYAELAGAAGVAGVLADLERHATTGAKVIALVTGAGWKDASERVPQGSQVLTFDPAEDDTAHLAQRWADKYTHDVTGEPIPKKGEDE